MGNEFPDRKDDDDALPVSDCKEWTFAQDEKSERTIILKLIQSESCQNSYQELFIEQSPPLGIDIPKQLVCLDEKYLKRCFELIHLNTGLLFDNLSFGNITSCDVPKYAVEYPMSVGVGDFVLGSEDDGIVGSIMGGNSMMNLLGSPLFRKLGISDRDPRLGGAKSFEIKRRVSSEYKGSPGCLTLSPSSSPRKKSSLGFTNHSNGNNFVHKNPISDSGASLLTDQSPRSSSSKGMLQCTWDDVGIPHFTFSLEGQKELYVADAAKVAKVEVINEKALDYVYSFHVRASGKKSGDISGIESDLVGKMKVSTTFSLCAGNSRVAETEFVLVGTSDTHAREIHPLTRNNRSRKVSKVMEMFKTGPSNKPRPPSILGGSSAIHEDRMPELLENEFIPNLELAAVVVKDRLQNKDQQEEAGGWGLKFLKKTPVKRTDDSLHVSDTACECHRIDAGNCSTSVDIVVPAGPHGGPRTKNGGPSSLIERWRSWGRCDCGGWDIGCPLKVFKARPRSEDGLQNSVAEGDCKTYDIFPEGSEQITPTLKVANISDGLYFISFQSQLLSPLQCFAIAVAMIHSKSPSLRRDS